MPVDIYVVGGHIVYAFARSNYVLNVRHYTFTGRNIGITRAINSPRREAGKMCCNEFCLDRLG